MLIYFITLVVLLTIIAAMSIGVIMGRKPIAGSCGGVGAALGEEDYVCEICGGDPDKCVENDAEDDVTSKQSRKLFYDAAN